MIKLSDRLRSCADLVMPGAVAADVGTDHGHLALYLLQQGISPRVFASDLRPGPLAAAKRSAEREQIAEGITFLLSDGLKNLPMEEIDTVILAGMGGDTIEQILLAEPAVFSHNMQLVLQPQSKIPELRRDLLERGFSIKKEILSRDGKFLYTAMDVRYTGKQCRLSPGVQYLPPWLLESEDPLLGDYCRRTLSGVEKTLLGLRRAKNPDPEQISHYEQVLRELKEMEASL